MVSEHAHPLQLPVAERYTEHVGAMFTPSMLAKLDKYVENHPGVKRSDVIRGAVELFLAGNLNSIQVSTNEISHEAEIRQSSEHVADATASGETQTEAKGE